MQLTPAELARFAARVNEERQAQADPREASSASALVAARRARVRRPRG